MLNKTKQNIIHSLNLHYILVFLFMTNTYIYSDNILAQTSEYEMKAVFFKTISQYVEWPATSDISDKTQPFTIAVLGQNPFGTILDDVYINGKRQIEDKDVHILYIENISELKQCHILFIAGSEAKHLEDVLSFVKDKPILTFADSKRFGEKGVHVNFFISNNKTRFELNESAALEAGIKVDFRLRKIALLVGQTKGR